MLDGVAVGPVREIRGGGFANKFERAVDANVLVRVISGVDHNFIERCCHTNGRREGGELASFAHVECLPIAPVDKMVVPRFASPELLLLGTRPHHRLPVLGIGLVVAWILVGVLLFLRA